MRPDANNAKLQISRYGRREWRGGLLEIRRRGQRQARERSLIVEAIPTDLVIPTEAGHRQRPGVDVQAGRQPRPRVSENPCVEIDRVGSDPGREARAAPAA